MLSHFIRDREPNAFEIRHGIHEGEGKRLVQEILDFDGWTGIELARLG